MEYPTVEHVQKTTAFKKRARAEGAIETLKWLEDGAPHKFDGLKGTFLFNMDNYQVNDGCGTVCCIAGAIDAFVNRLDGDEKRFRGRGDLHCSFHEEQDLDKRLSKLFYPNLIHYNSITPVEAAEALRNYLEKGVVDWSHVKNYNEIKDEY